MDKKRKFCAECNEEYSARYYRRHICTRGKKSTQELELSLSYDSLETVSYSDVNDASGGEGSTILDDIGESSNDSQGENYNANENLVSSDSDDEVEGFADTIDLQEFLESNLESDDETDSIEENGHLLYILRIILEWKSHFFISDLALSFILLIIKTLLYLCSSSEFSKHLYTNFPSTLFQLDKFVSFKRDYFEKYVICPKCFSLYKYDDCFVMVEGIKETKRCAHVIFPNHPMTQFRKPCGEELLKTLIVNGSKKIVARKTYCYKKIRESIQTYVLRKGFEEKCEYWRSRNVPDNVLMDIYDGDIWKAFQEKNDFFKDEREYALMLNVDWFQPFKHTNYSVGAIYVTILNLPREERFKRENVILIGLIPDMTSEPPTNTFLEPFVEEMKEAWEGMYLKSYTSDKLTKFRLALLCVGCDVPASRKLCGFLGHNATMGCNKCMKSFPGGIGEKRFGGFDVSTWENRTDASHRRIVAEIVKAKTKGQKEELERKYGVRYSVLLELPYFYPVRMTIIDPMHNLFLGTAKRVMKLWIKYDIINAGSLKTIEEKIEKVICPSDVGKLPQKFASSYGSFNADQWKNWTILFSIYALTDIVPANHLEYWRKFVIACKLLCCKTLTRNNVKVAQLLLVSFCQTLEHTLGEQAITPNMHLHCHLAKCIYDFGPVYSFWLFSFERENGILGSIPTNKRFIEIQLMRNFLKNVFTSDILCDENIVPDLGPHLYKLRQLSNCSDRGTLGEVGNKSDFTLIHMSSRNFDVANGNYALDLCSYVQSSTLKNLLLEENELSHLNVMYNVLYPNIPEGDMTVCRTCRSSKSILIHGSLLGSNGSRSTRSSMIVAYWHQENGQIATFNNVDIVPHPGRIKRILIHNIIVDGESKVHILAHVEWFQCCNEDLKLYYGKPIEVWCGNVFEQEGPASYIPIQRIRSKFVFAYNVLHGKNVVIVIPRERFST